MKFLRSIMFKGNIQSLGLTIKGVCTIRSKIFKEDGSIEVLPPKTYTNIVNKRAYETLFSNNRVFDSTREIGISTNNEPISYGTTSISNVIAIADGSAFSPNDYVFTPYQEGVNPNYVTFSKRLATPLSTRTYQTISLGIGTPNNDTGGVSMDCFSYLVLPSPKTQLTNQVDDIDYQVSVSWDNPPQELSPYFQENLELLILGQFPGSVFPSNGIGYGYIETSLSNASLNSSTSLPFDLTRPNLEGTGSTVTDSLPLLKKRVLAANTGSFLQNFIHYGVSCGRLETVDTQAGKFKGGGLFIPYQVPSKVSRVYSHNAGTESMYDDPNNYATSSWRPVVVDNGIPTRGKLPYVFQIVVKSSGGLGTGGSYFYRKGVFSGGIDTGDIRNVPWGHVSTQFFPAYSRDDRELIPYRVEWIYPWNRETDIVSANKTKVGIWQCWPELDLLEEIDLAPSGIVRIRDLAVDLDNDLIYAAGDGGLISIDVSTPGAPVIVVLSSDACRCVDVSFGGAVFAILLGGSGGDRLASSLLVDWDTPYTFSGTIDYSKTVFIRCAKNAAHELAILEHRFDLYLPALTNATLAVSDYFQKIHFFSVASGYASTIDCEVKKAGASNWSKATSLKTNNSFVYKDGVWAYYKFLQNTNSITASLVRGYLSEALEVYEESGLNIIAANNGVNIASIILPTIPHFGMATFGQEISAHTYSASTSVNNGFTYGGYHGSPAIQIMSVDIPGGIVRACVVGYNHIASTSGGYGAVRLRETFGAYDFEVTDSGTNTGNRDEFHAFQDIDNFQFTHYNSGSGSTELYYMGNNIVYLEGKGFLCFGDSGVGTLDNGFGGYNEDVLGSTQPFYHPLVVSLWGVPNKTAFTYPEWMTQYGWDSIGSQWVVDQLGVEGGKPIHLASELLDADVSIDLGWEDLAPLQMPPQSSQDLVIDQTYTFVVIPYENGFVADGTYTSGQQVSYAVRLGPTVLVEGFSSTIPSGAPYTLDIPEATSDVLFGAIDDEDAFFYGLQINGVDAAIVFNTAPSPGEIAINTATRTAGTLTFNSADASLSVTGDYVYLQKNHPTEVIS